MAWCIYVQVRVAANSRNSAWAAYDGRNRREIKQGDRYNTLHSIYIYSFCTKIHVNGTSTSKVLHNTNVHQSHSQNDSGDLRGVARGDGKLGCLCGKAGTSHLCDGSAWVCGQWLWLLFTHMQECYNSS